MREVYDFLKRCGTYFLATVENGEPRVRPFGTVDLFEDRLYIQTGKSKACFRQMRTDPHIAISAANGGQWLCITAEAVDDDRTEAKAHMLDAYPELKGLYSADDPNTAVLWLKNATAVFSSFSAPSRTVQF